MAGDSRGDGVNAGSTEAGGGAVAAGVGGAGVGNGVVVSEGAAARGLADVVAVSVMTAGGTGSTTIGRPPLPLTPGGTDPGAKGSRMTPVR
jgi:hypothetical protein